MNFYCIKPLFNQLSLCDLWTRYAFQCFNTGQYLTENNLKQCKLSTYVLFREFISTFFPLHSSLACIKNVEEFNHLRPEKGAGKAFHYIYLRLF